VISTDTVLANIRRHLVPGESVQHVQQLVTCSKSPLGWSQTGTAYVTNWRFVFLQDVEPSKDAHCLPLTSLWSVKQKVLGNELVVTIKSKLHYTLALLIRTSATPSTSNDIAALFRSFVPKQVALVFAFSYQDKFGLPSDATATATASASSASGAAGAAVAATAAPSAGALSLHSSDVNADPADGWDWFDLRSDLLRVMRGSDAWRLTTLNAAFELCASYPDVLAVPSAMTDQELRRVAQFRSSSRLPVLSWIHPTTGAAIVRSSQPLVSFKRKRCFEDEKLVCNIRDANTRPGASDVFYILDARPKANVLANTAIGGGVEDKEAYPDCEIDFLDIANIHVVRTAYEAMIKLHTAPHDTAPHYQAALDQAGWLALVLDVLRGTKRMVETLQQGHSVLSHCSDGWDRTSQLTSLTMLALDPSYRTLRGFACLIEKEWLAAGHKVQQRHGVGEFADDAEQISPIFLHFLDCVHQLLRQHPTAFEFNQALLIRVLDESYAHRFGTFLYNTARQRCENKVRQRTVSLWTYVGANRAKYTNAFYRPHPQPLTVHATPARIVVWDAHFDRHKGTALDNERALAKVMRDAKESSDAVWMQLDVMKNMIRDLDAENNKLKKAAAK
jgi:hypothetical protein